jgi:hypothetical protein
MSILPVVRDRQGNARIRTMLDMPGMVKQGAVPRDRNQMQPKCNQSAEPISPPKEKPRNRK